MTIIKTYLRTTVTDQEGNIELFAPDKPKAFNGVYDLGLILGSRNVNNRRFPVDDDGLKDLKKAVNGVTEYCLLGLQGIGGLIALSNPESPLTNQELYGVGLVIQQLSLMVYENQDHLENIELDMMARKTAKGGNHE